MAIAFDVDSTLIDDQDRWIDPACQLARAYYRQGHDLWVWSGGGADYAATWAMRLERSWHVKVSLTFAKGDPRKLVPLPAVAVDDSWDFLSALAERGAECWWVDRRSNIVIPFTSDPLKRPI
jgi:hypothetical protein